MEEKKSKRMLFPYKLFQILDDSTTEGFESIISWMPTSSQPNNNSNNNGGKTIDDASTPRSTTNPGIINDVIIHPFRVHKPKEFENTIMPRYFRGSNKYRTFTRSLNLWCFERVDKKGPLKNAYYHPLFKRDQPHLCGRIIRMKNKKMKQGEQQADNNFDDCCQQDPPSSSSSSQRHLDEVAPPEEMGSWPDYSLSSSKPPAKLPSSSSLSMLMMPNKDTASGTGDFWCGAMMKGFDPKPFPIMAKKSDAETMPFSPPPPPATTIVTDSNIATNSDMLLLDDAFSPRPIGAAAATAIAASNAARMNEESIARNQQEGGLLGGRYVCSGSWW